ARYPPALAGSFNGGRHHRGFAGDFPRNPQPAGAAGAAGSNRAVLDRAIRTLSALGAGAGGGAGGDVCARGFDPQKPALAKAGVKAITEALCGHSFSASSISAMNQGLDASLAQFAGRPLAEAFPYLILDA